MDEHMCVRGCECVTVWNVLASMGEGGGTGVCECVSVRRDTWDGLFVFIFVSERVSAWM